MPEVTSAGMMQTLPMRGDYMLSFTIQGQPAPKPNEGPSANYRVVSPDYFQAMGIPLVRGRAFTDRDVEKAPMVAVVDQKFVERHFPDEDPIGQGIDIGNGTDGFYEIVGVVGNVRDASLEHQPGADDVRAVRAGSVQRHVGRGADDRRSRRRCRRRCGRRSGDRRSAAGVRA